MELAEYGRFFLSLAFIIGLIFVCAWVAKKLGLDKKLRGVTAATGRLQVADTLYLDPKRKLVLVRADAREYVILLHGDRATVVDKLDGKPNV